MLSLTYKIESPHVGESVNSDDNATCNDLRDDDNLRKRYNYGTISPEFLNSDIWVDILDSLINRLENIEKCQSQIDSFHNEMLFNVYMPSHQLFGIEKLKEKIPFVLLLISKKHLTGCHVTL